MSQCNRRLKLVLPQRLQNVRVCQIPSNFFLKRSSRWEEQKKGSDQMRQTSLSAARTSWTPCVRGFWKCRIALIQAIATLSTSNFYNYKFYSYENLGICAHFVFWIIILSCKTSENELIELFGAEFFTKIKILILASTSAGIICAVKDSEGCWNSTRSIQWCIEHGAILRHIVALLNIRPKKWRKNDRFWRYFA